jgi:ethanolamine transporter EutH
VESFVNYPTWPLIGVNEFRAYHRALGPLIIGYMVIPMLVTTLLTILLLWFRPARIPRWMVWFAIVLQLVVWISTAAIQLPIQGQLSADGLSLPLIDRLRVTSFWLRRVPHMANALLFLWMMSVVLRGKARGPLCGKDEGKN